jgi:hypothetical protein
MSGYAASSVTTRLEAPAGVHSVTIAEVGAEEVGV